MSLIYSPDGTNVYGLRGGSLRG